MSLDPDELVDDTNWHDMRIDEVGTIMARLSSVGYGSPGTLVLTFPDWADLIVHTDRPRDVKPIAIGTLVRVRVKRTEDGLHALVIRNTTGGVPIPLMDTPDAG